MDKLDIILEKLSQVDLINSKLDKIEADVGALRNDNKVINKKLDVITNELADIKEKVTDHHVKIQVINAKTKAL